MKILIIIVAVIIIVYLTGAITLQTNIPEVNASLNLPVSIPIKDIITVNPQANPNQIFVIGFTL